MLDACLALLDTEEEKQRFTEVYHANKRLVHYVAYRVLGDEHLVRALRDGCESLRTTSSSPLD